jgi:transposase InsO family protein
MRFAFIAAKKAEHRVTILCRCMRVTRSGFYAWLRRGLSARAQRDVVLRTKLRAFHVASGHRYGRPRLWKDLKEDGEALSEKRVRRLMRDEQIQGRVPKRFKHTTDSDHDDPIAANVLARDFTAAAPNQRWVSDTTEFVIGDSAKLYLAAVLDLFSRFVVGWAISAVNDRRRFEADAPDVLALTKPTRHVQPTIPESNWRGEGGGPRERWRLRTRHTLRADARGTAAARARHGIFTGADPQFLRR